VVNSLGKFFIANSVFEPALKILPLKMKGDRLGFEEK
jgi:hypothetical protein